VRVVEGAGYLVLWVTVPRIYFVLIFYSRIQGFLFVISNCTDGYMRLSKQEIKPETNFISIAA
jgi:hypothetical protein